MQRNRLEIELQRELDLAAPVLRIGNLTEHFRRKLNARTGKLRAVEKIVKLRTELQRPLTAAGQPERAADRKIPVESAGGAECI